MRITGRQLRTIIKEELRRLGRLNEASAYDKVKQKHHQKIDEYLESMELGLHNISRELDVDPYTNEIDPAAAEDMQVPVQEAISYVVELRGHAANPSSPFPVDMFPRLDRCLTEIEGLADEHSPLIHQGKFEAIISLVDDIASTFAKVIDAYKSMSATGVTLGTL